MSSFCIACNNCSKHLDATAIRTACDHLFCLVCSTEHFSNGCTCPTCHTTLSSKHIGEVIVGIPPMSVKQCMLQLVLQSSEWEDIAQAVQHIRHAADEVTTFVQKQLLLAGSSDHQRRASLVSQLEESRAELSRTIAKARSQSMTAEQQISELNHQCGARTRELGELQEAYKEKKRQCDAWEKTHKRFKEEVTRGQQQDPTLLKGPDMGQGQGAIVNYDDINNVNNVSGISYASGSAGHISSNNSSVDDINRSYSSDHRTSISGPMGIRAPQSTTTTTTTTDSTMIVHNKRPHTSTYHQRSTSPALSAMNLSAHNAQLGSHRAHQSQQQQQQQRQQQQFPAGGGQGDSARQSGQPGHSIYGSTFASFHNSKAAVTASGHVSGQASRFFDKMQ